MDRLIENKWITRWKEERVFDSDRDPAREKKMVTFPFPYMNGPLHLGHAFTATRVDVYARFKRMQGYDTIFPWAWHWTGQPIVAAAERLSKGDSSMIHEFVDIDKVPREELPKFYDPKFMAQYYTDSGRDALKRLGLSIDWRREFHTTDLEPTFNKFVLWQYNRLRQMGYVTRGTHPVVWCPRDQSPTGDHDRLEGQGVQWEEFTLIFFNLEGGDCFLPAATFRPETIFGVTNLWLNPTSEYVEISVDGKRKWIVSAEASEKLKDQLHTIHILRNIPGTELIGKRVFDPLHPKRLLPILPAKFVDPDNGTGVVYSVPAHAPMDYVALRDIQSDKEIQQEFNLGGPEMSSIKPIPLISVEGMGELPAKQVIEDLKISNQTDPKVEEATNIVYKKEFHLGVLNESTGRFRGLKVSEAKPMVVEDLRKSGISDAMYDLPEKVVCRCLTRCRVKILEDQWFLKYSDPEWKKTAHECIDRAEMYPESIRRWFHDVIDWIKDWPCARRVGLGTPLAWSPGWIVETLSDSTIYMAFYTIRPSIVSENIQPDSLTDEFFDYVFLGLGEKEKVAQLTALAPELLERMRKEFLYWYPVNLRNSAKELIPNHLMFFVFQHVAFFPRDLWPLGISANGMMMTEGEKMSKSKGNVITVSSALERFGADVIRATLMDGAEGLDDMDWREKNANDVQGKINALPNFISGLISSARTAEKSKKDMSDLWLENQIQKHIRTVCADLDAMRTKSAFQDAFYSFWNDLRFYQSRSTGLNLSVVNYAIDVWLRLLAPFVPYSAEEINENLGNQRLISISDFPKVDKTRVHPDAELSEDAVQRLIEDSNNILKLMQQRPSKLFVYTAPDWAYDLFSRLIEGRRSAEKNSDTLRAFFLANPDIDKRMVSTMLSKLSKSINELGEDFLNLYRQTTGVDEKAIYEESLGYLAGRFDVQVKIEDAIATTYDPKKKAAYALPFKPALYFE